MVSMQAADHNLNCPEGAGNLNDIKLLVCVGRWH